MTDQANLDAVIVRSIGDILAAKKHAVESMGPRLWKEAGEVFGEAGAVAGWSAVVDAEAEDAWLVQDGWLLPEAEDDADFWLGLDERIGQDDGEDSWIASFTGTGPEGATMALWVHQRFLGKGGWKKLFKANGALIEQLRGHGFQLDENDDRRLCLPFTIDQEALARAFEEDDFEAALQPIAAVVATAIAAGAELNRLRELAKAAR